METDEETNIANERSHVTHEYLVTTLATLCTSQDNVDCIVPCLVEDLTALCECVLFDIRLLCFMFIFRTILML